MSIDAAFAEITERLERTLGALTEQVARIESLRSGPQPLVYTPGEAAVVLGISEDLVRKWVQRGVLPRLPETTSVLIPRIAVEAFVRSAQKRAS